MKKSVLAVLATVSVVSNLGIVPVLAANSDYIGSYVAYEIDGNGHASLDIKQCDDSSVVLEFAREKNNTQTFTYKVEQGTMDGTTGTLTFDAVTSSGSEIPGTMTITLQDNKMVKVKLVSDQGQTFYEGIMSPTQTANNNGSAPTSQPLSDKITILVNGNEMTFDEGVEPSIINDYTYVPLRSVFKNMGINVFWDEYSKNDALKQQLITCTKNNTIVQFSRTRNTTDANTWVLNKWVDKCTDGTATENIDISSLQPMLIGEYSYIPLRVVSEAFGAKVDWDGDTRSVIIESDTDSEYRMDDETVAKNEDFTSNLARSYITADYTAVYSNSEPYFAPQGKFYKFEAKDQWNSVVLRIFTGGYVDVYLSDQYSSTIITPSAVQSTGSVPVTNADTGTGTNADASGLSENNSTDTAESSETTSADTEQAE